MCIYMHSIYTYIYCIYLRKTIICYIVSLGSDSNLHSSILTPRIALLFMELKVYASILVRKKPTFLQSHKEKSRKFCINYSKILISRFQSPNLQIHRINLSFSRRFTASSQRFSSPFGEVFSGTSSQFRIVREIPACLYLIVTL